jgi:hypothetical protein
MLFWRRPIIAAISGSYKKTRSLGENLIGGGNRTNLDAF